MTERESWGDKPYRKDMDFSKCEQSEPTDEYGTPQEIANAVHHMLDWCRAVEKRKWDTRPPNNPISILKQCQKGIIVDKYNHLHYDEDSERH